MIHVYAIARRLDELPAMQGLGGAPVERRRIDGFEVVVSRTEKTIEPSKEGAVRHGRVIEALLPRSDAILPARFGHAFSDEGSLATAVLQNRAELERGLARVQGCVEFGVRILLPETNAIDGRAVRSGREYMERRLEQASNRRALADEVRKPLAALARASTRLGHSPREPLLTAAYLVPEQSVEAFRSEVQRLQELHADLSIVCTGPWPPYSFAADAEMDG